MTLNVDCCCASANQVSLLQRLDEASCKHLPTVLERSEASG